MITIDGKMTQLYKDNMEIQKITFTGSTVNIPNDAFNGCSNLRDVDFGEATEITIGGNAFYNSGIIQLEILGSESEKKK